MPVDLALALSWGAQPAPGSPWLGRSGLEWLDLGALGALAGSIWTPWPLLARPGWLDQASCWLDLAANECPIDSISKKND